MARGTPHSAETKAAVLAALLTGQSVSHVARQFRLSRATVSVWRAAAGLDGSPPVNHEKKGEIGDLVLRYLEAVLITLVAQQQLFRDSGWLRTQSAADLAVLHGVLADKAFRLLSALEPVDADLTLST